MDMVVNLFWGDVTMKSALKKGCLENTCALLEL